ncbi:uncharacterized protein LOC124292330 [Haliotis rubra]|uniref:uncharacterized protein LOC124292330 n=1 Tax=Haliotis rubra TaxID=36100 RepID=UPI001EE4FFCE|nr:uncharacterized protein LOC124292330 [Haliotis rubra]
MVIKLCFVDAGPFRVESEYGLDKDGEDIRVEGHTASRQGNTVVELTVDTQDDEGSTDTGQDTFASPRQKTGHIQFVIGCILLATIPLIIRAMHINSCPGDARLGHYMIRPRPVDLTTHVDPGVEGYRTRQGEQMASWYASFEANPYIAVDGHRGNGGP